MVSKCLINRKLISFSKLKIVISYRPLFTDCLDIRRSVILILHNDDNTSQINVTWGATFCDVEVRGLLRDVSFLVQLTEL